MALASSGCASARGSFADLAVERDRIADLDARLGRLGRFPDTTTMTGDARLVTFLYATPGSTEMRRDTIVGSAQVAAWLTQWHARQLPAVDFALTNGDVRSCDRTAAQTGTFPMMPTGSGGSASTRPYRAVWVRTADDGWALSRLWLDPDHASRRETVGSGCRSLGQAERAMRRFTVGFGSAWSGHPAGSPMEEALVATGWGADSRGQSFPWTQQDGVSFQASLGYRVTPLLGVKAVVLQHPGTTAHGRNEVYVMELTLRESDRVVALLGSLDLGLVHLGAGPAVALVDFDWRPVHSRLDPTSTRRTTVGALAEAMLMAPMAARARPYVSVRYVALGDAEVPPYFDVEESFLVPLGRAGFSFGVEVAF